MIVVLEREDQVDVIETINLYKRVKEGIIYFTTPNPDALKYHPEDKFIYSGKITLSDYKRVYVLEGGVKHFILD